MLRLFGVLETPLKYPIQIARHGTGKMCLFSAITNGEMGLFHILRKHAKKVCRQHHKA
jgi:hypothetical protein